MFTVADRERLRETLVAAARADDRIDGAALLGSSASGSEDRFSDIDLGLGIAPGADREAVIADWTATMHSEHGAVDHFDVRAQGLYRVFLLEDTLQVDLSFWAPGELRALAPAFRRVFGVVGVPQSPAPRDPHELVGLAWLYLIHARSSLARARPWQAEQMLTSARTHVLALACVRRDLISYEGRGTDRLPPELLARAAEGLVGSLARAPLERALGVVTGLLIDETASLDAALADRLRPTLEALVASARG